MSLITRRHCYCLSLPFALAALIFMSGCSGLLHKGISGAPRTDDEVTDSDSSERFETIVLFSTGNLQGALLPAAKNQGDAALLTDYFKIARKDFGPRMVWLDAGRLRGHALEYDFDRGQGFENFLKKSSISLALDSMQQPFALLDAGRLKLGVIQGKTKGEILLRAQQARNAGAQLVVWLSDLPVQCNPHVIKPIQAFHRPGDLNGFCEGPLNDIVSRLPQGTLNAVLTTGNDRQVQHYIFPLYSADAQAGVPIAEDAPFGKSVHLIYLTYDLVNHKPVFAKTRIEGPVPICGRILKNQGDCDGTSESLENGRGAWVRSRFHGRTIEPDSEIEQLTLPARDWIRSQERDILAKTDRDLAANPRGESAFADLLADAIREETHSDFALVNPGLVKHALGQTALHTGTISAADLSRAVPADAAILVLRVSGEELKTLVRISENGSRGFAAISGMRLRLIRPDREAPATDLNGDRILSLWEQNRLVRLTDMEDEPIHSKRIYRLAVPDYLVLGGDDWKWATDQYGLARRIDSWVRAPSARALLANYLRRIGSIGDVPTRIQFVEPKSKQGRRRSHRRRHSAGRKTGQ